MQIDASRYKYVNPSAISKFSLIMLQLSKQRQELAISGANKLHFHVERLEKG